MVKDQNSFHINQNTLLTNYKQGGLGDRYLVPELHGTSYQSPSPLQNYFRAFKHKILWKRYTLGFE